MQLRQMRSGQRGKISKITVQGELGRRLREMGFIPGSEIRVEGRAPLYDPVRIRLGGQVLTLRNSEADHIEVQAIDQIHDQEAGR